MLQMTVPSPYPPTVMVPPPPPPRRRRRRRGGRWRPYVQYKYCPTDAIPPLPIVTYLVNEDIDVIVSELGCNSDTRNQVKFSHDEKCVEMKGYSEDKFAQTAQVKKMSSCLMVEILSRLPVKSLMRFKCVCRPWDSLMREQYFINKHMENQRAKKENGIIIGTGHWLGSFFSLHYTKEGGPIEYKCTVNRQNSGLSSDARVGMSNSCNGLVCFFAERISFICNPATREYNVLPVGTADARRLDGLKDPFCYTGLGFGTSTGEYKVVRFFRIEKGYGCEAFTLGSHSWRRIENAPRGVICKPAFVNGRINWDLYSGPGYDNCAVVSFDVNTERFDLISYPEMQLQPWFCFMFQLGGHLCLGANYTEGLMDLWVLKDYSKNEWIKKFRINLTTISGFSRDIQSDTWPLTIWKGKLLMSFKLKLDLYDTVDMSFKQVMESGDSGDGDNLQWFCYEHVETLVSPSISPV